MATRRLFEFIVTVVVCASTASSATARQFTIGGDVGRFWEDRKRDLHNAPPVVKTILNAQPLVGYALGTSNNPAGDLLTTYAKAGGDTLKTVQKAGGDTITTVQKAGSDTVATYEKGWRDTRDQTVRSFNDTVDAGHAVVRYHERQLASMRDVAAHARDRVAEGKVVDAVWGAAVEPLQAEESNFAKATQESQVINEAAQSAAAIYGGPGGAAAYAAWYTYRSTGDTNLAIRAGVMSAITSEAGGTVAHMPTGTAGEVLKKAAVAGAIGGISVAAAGGNEKDVTDAFLQSGGAVLVQDGTHYVDKTSPRLSSALKTAKCLSSVNVDCVSDLTYVKDTKGRILKKMGGGASFDTKKYDPRAYVGKWQTEAQNSEAGKTVAYLTSISKVPKSEAVALFGGKWVVTSTVKPGARIEAGTPAVVLTYVGANAGFYMKTRYSRRAHSGGGTGAAPAASSSGVVASYSCHAGGIPRTVVVRASLSRDSCDAYYEVAGRRTLVWESHHGARICSPKAAQFVATLEGKGVACSR